MKERARLEDKKA